jgi:CBS domain-containing membrane protein
MRSLGPALPRPAAPETLRAALGAGLALIVTNGVLGLVAPQAGAMLIIAPFGASAFLIFMVPSSPLAQPWSAVVGNSVSALVALGVLMLPLPGAVQGGLAVALAIPAMALVRAQHPPGGAVALVTVLMAVSGHAPGLAWVASPVALGSLVLALSGMGWAALTGRVYPFRTPAPSVTAHGTADAPPLRRLTPSPAVLAESLTQLRLAANIGVEDLARVIDRAEAASPDLTPGALHAQAIMSQDVVAVGPDTALPELAALFRAHGFKSLPVLDRQGHFLGLVRQVALVGRAEPDLTAADLAGPVASLPPEAPLSALVTALADGGQEAVPILAGGHLQGIVTRSDLIAALLHDLGLR